MPTTARERHLPVGGPDFDHGYLLPELDGLAASCRPVYDDQRGRGRSRDGVRPSDVTIASEMDDIDHVRRAMHEFAIPTLLIHGERDFIPVVVAEHIAAAIPGAVLDVLPNCGHFALPDPPDDVNERVAAFVHGA